MTLDDIKIGTNLAPGDLGYVAYLHGRLYAEECMNFHCKTFVKSFWLIPGLMWIRITHLHISLGDAFYDAVKDKFSCV